MILQCQLVIFASGYLNEECIKMLKITIYQENVVGELSSANRINGI